MDGSSTGVYVITKAPHGPFIEGHVADMSFVGWLSNILKRAARSSSSADTQQACNTNDEVLAAQLLRSEPNGHTSKKHNVTDAMKGRLDSLSWMQTECTTRHICSSSRLKDSIEEDDADAQWCHSDIQLAEGTGRKKVARWILLCLRAPR